MLSASFEWFSLMDTQIASDCQKAKFIVVSKDALQLVPKLYGIYEFEVFYAPAPNHLSTLHPGALARRGISATYLIRLRRHSIWDANELQWYVDFATITECRHNHHHHLQLVVCYKCVRVKESGDRDTLWQQQQQQSNWNWSWPTSQPCHHNHHQCHDHTSIYCMLGIWDKMLTFVVQLSLIFL